MPLYTDIPDVVAVAVSGDPWVVFNCNILSSTSTVCVLSVVVVPPTVKLPVIVTLFVKFAFCEESNGNITLQQKGTIKYEENTDVDSAAAEAIASVVKATHTAAFFDYVIKKGTNVRAGVVVACHDGTNVEYAETSTVDLGDTSDVTLSVDISGTIMRLMATTTSNDWSVKSLIRGI